MPEPLLIFVSPEKARDPRYQEAQSANGQLIAHPGFTGNDMQVAVHVPGTKIWKLQVASQIEALK